MCDECAHTRTHARIQHPAPLHLPTVLGKNKLHWHEMSLSSCWPLCIWVSVRCQHYSGYLPLYLKQHLLFYKSLGPCLQDMSVITRTIGPNCCIPIQYKICTFITFHKTPVDCTVCDKLSILLVHTQPQSCEIEFFFLQTIDWINNDETILQCLVEVPGSVVALLIIFAIWIPCKTPNC